MGHSNFIFANIRNYKSTIQIKDEKIRRLEKLLDEERKKSDDQIQAFSKFLRSNLSIETVCRVLVLADLHGARELKQDAVRFVAQNSTKVIQTDGWRQLIISSPTLVTEVESAISAELAEQACSSGVD